MTLQDRLDGQDFYELMQIYRHATEWGEPNVFEAFEAVKTYIRAIAEAENARLREDAERLDFLESRFHIDGTGDDPVYSTFVPMHIACETLRAAIDAARAGKP